MGTTDDPKEVSAKLAYEPKEVSEKKLEYEAKVVAEQLLISGLTCALHTRNCVVLTNGCVQCRGKPQPTYARRCVSTRPAQLSGNPRLTVNAVAQHCTLSPAHGPTSLGQCFEIVLDNKLCNEHGVRKHSLDDVQALCVAEAPPDLLSEIPAEFQ